LQSDTDAEDRGILSGLDENIVERFRVTHTLAECTDPREDQRFRVSNFGWVARKGHRRIGPFEPTPKAPEISDPVIDDGDVHIRN
jgi:hypothetical protein